MDGPYVARAGSLPQAAARQAVSTWLPWTGPGADPLPERAMILYGARDAGRRRQFSAARKTPA